MEVLVELLNPERAYRSTVTDMLVNSKWLASERDKAKLTMSDAKRKLSDGPHEISLEGMCSSRFIELLSHSLPFLSLLLLPSSLPSSPLHTEAIGIFEDVLNPRRKQSITVADVLCTSQFLVAGRRLTDTESVFNVGTLTTDPLSHSDASPTPSPSPSPIPSPSPTASPSLVLSPPAFSPRQSIIPGQEMYPVQTADEIDVHAGADGRPSAVVAHSHSPYTHYTRTHLQT